MKKIISDIHNGEQNSRKTIEFLQKNSKRTWVEEYPIAITDDINSSKSSYSTQDIDDLIKNNPSSIKTAYCLCLKEKYKGDYHFEKKSENDSWKKITDEDNFEACIESTRFTDEDNGKIMETTLRNILQSSKEIPSLKEIGFAWIVTLPKTMEIEYMLNHYFLDNHIFIEKGRKITYIAWADKLIDINMRNYAKTPRGKN